MLSLEAAVSLLGLKVFRRECRPSVTKTYNYKGGKTQLGFLWEMSKILMSEKPRGSPSICDLWFKVNVRVNRMFNMVTVADSVLVVTFAIVLLLKYEINECS